MYLASHTASSSSYYCSSLGVEQVAAVATFMHRQIRGQPKQTPWPTGGPTATPRETSPRNDVNPPSRRVICNREIQLLRLCC
jgi:hypothetical protein